MIAAALIISTVIIVLAIRDESNQNKKLNQVIMKLTDLAAKLTAIDASVTSIAASVAALETSLTDVEIPADAQAALDKLTADTAALSATVNPPAAPAADAPAV